jgi:6-phosphogluconolactonase
MNLRIFDTAADAVIALARLIEQKARSLDHLSVGISGGSTPRPLYELLGSSPMCESLAERPITWVVVDERHVPSNDPQSNARMIRATLFDDPAKTARQFEAQWHAFGLNALDLVTLGIGDDGHTASLFPGTSVLDVKDHIAAAVYVPRLEQWRVTLTLPVIQAAKLRIVLAAGESKAPIVRDVAQGVDHPVTRAMSGDGEAWWFLDKAAASLLPR